MSPMFQGGNTALIWAAMEGHVSCVEVLVQAGANLNTQNNYRETALIFAAKNGHVSCLELLVQAGANLNTQTKVRDECGDDGCRV